MPEPEYTHADKDGLKWRFEGSRPISELADAVMAELAKADEHPECFRCGECCKHSACAFGEWEEYPADQQPNKWDHYGQCKYLVPMNRREKSMMGYQDAMTEGIKVELFKCSIAHEIMKDPTSEFSPAFGAGCCRSLFNRSRDRLIKLKEGR